MYATALDPSYRIATVADHGLVVQMLEELVDELGPQEMAIKVKRRLPDDITAALATPLVRVFIAEVDGKPVGLGRADVLTTDPIFRLRDDNRCGYVDQMYVRMGHRDRGIGSQLLRLCEDWFREQGIGHTLLHAAPKAVRFYGREGYQANREMFKRLI
jgi:GNAT superfamily N-acetyltransferase